MGHAAKVVGEVGMSRDERSMLLGNGGETSGGSSQQLLIVLGAIRDAAKSVMDGRANRRWADECMNQLIVGVEAALAQGWGEVVDAFTDTGRILQSYENAGVTAEAAPYLVEAYDLMTALVHGASSGEPASGNVARWRSRYQHEVTRLEIAGFALANDDDPGADGADGDDAFAFPDLSSNIVRLRPQDDLPTLDELPALNTMLSGGAKPKSAQPARAEIVMPPTARKDVTRPSRFEEARAAQAPVVEAPKVVQPSRTVVEIVDRICDELGGLPQRSADDRALSLETIKGGIAALKREAANHNHSISSELCDDLLQACALMTEDGAQVDESFTDLGFAFCGVYVEAMGNSASENVSEWRAECRELLDTWLELATRPEATESEAPALAVDAVPAPAAPAADATTEPEAKDEGVWIGSAPEPVTEATAVASVEMPTPVAPAPEPVVAAAPVVVPEPIVAVAPKPVAPPVIAQAAPSRPAQMPSAELFLRAQEALARGDSDGAKALALQAAAMIAEAEVDKAERTLHMAEAKLKSNVIAIEDARSDVKNTEKMVMGAASEVAAGETVLGQIKIQTAKVATELQEAEAGVASLERQIAELQAALLAQQAEVTNVSAKLDEARNIESQSETQVNGLRDRERDTRKELESARQRVKDRQRVSAEIEAEMDRAREQLSRQRTSLSDIRQTINRPEPIKTGGAPAEPDTLLF